MTERIPNRRAFLAASAAVALLAASGSFAQSINTGRQVAVMGQRASPPSGLLPTNFAVAPTVHFHVQTATLTFLGGAATFTCSASSGSQTVTIAACVGSLLVGQVISIPSLQDGSRVVSFGTFNGTSGTITVSTTFPAAVTAGTAGSATGANVVIGIADRMNHADLTTGDGMGPILAYDGRGRKVLQFANVNGQSSGVALRNVSAPSGMSDANMTWLMVGRIPAQTSVYQNRMVALGVNGASPPNVYPVMTAGGTSDAAGPRIPVPVVAGVGVLTNSTSVSNRGDILVGSNLNVWGTSVATADGMSGSGQSVVVKHLANDKVVSVSGTVVRHNSVTGFTLGTQISALAQAALFNVYELAGWVGGEFTFADYAAQSAAASLAMRTNWGIVPFTKRVWMGVADSRTQENYFNNNNLAMLATEPGSAAALPASTQVINIAFSGGTVQNFASAIDDPLGPFESGLMMGGGNDTVVMFDGLNEMLNDSPTWPITNTLLGTNARADEVYDGAGVLNAVVTGYIVNYVLTVTAVTSGVVRVNMPISASGLARGGRVISLGTGTGGVGTYNLSKSGSVFSSGTPGTLTATWTSYRAIAQTLIDRGFNLAIGVDYNKSSGTTANVARERLRNYQRNIGADMGVGNASKVRVADIPLITVGGLKVLGDDGANISNWFRDNQTHPTDLGRSVLWTGGDTPQYGLRSALA